MKKANKVDNLISIKFSVSRDLFNKELDKVKSITGRKFDPVSKLWTVPFTVPNAKLLKSWGYELDEELHDLLYPKEDVTRFPEPQKEYDESVLSVLPHKLRPYQIEATRFLEANSWNGMLSLGCRMGKTVCSLVGTLIHSELTPTLILTTATGKNVWEEEIELWLGRKSIILQGITPYELPPCEFIICNYAIIPAWTDYLLSLGFQYFIVDEVHNTSNSKNIVQKSEEEYLLDIEVAIDEGEDVDKVRKGKAVPVQCTQAFERLSKEIPHVVELSGTPITTCPKQLRIPLSVYVKQFRNEYWFLNKFCDKTHNGYAWVYEGLSNEKELYPILDKWMFRRTKEQVWKDLPEQQHQFIPVDIDMELYEKELRELKKEYKKTHMDDDELDAHFAKFASLSYAQKRKTVIDWVKEYLKSGEKIILFAWHRSVVEDLHEVFKKNSVMLYGDTSGEDRVKARKSFNSDPKCKIFIGQIKSCMEAITLSGSDTVAYVEIPFTAGQLQQTMERPWIAEGGQKHLCYYYFVAKDTCDESRVERLKERAKLISRTLDKNGESGVLFGQSLKDIVEED